MRKLLRTWRCRALRRIMRGSRRLRSSGNSEFVEACYEAIIEAEDCGWYPIGGGSLLAREIPVAAMRRSLSQYLSYRVGLLLLPEAILYAHGRCGASKPDPIICILPVKMRRILAAQGLIVDHARSQLLWMGYVMAMWAYGTVTALRLFLDHRSHRMAFPPEATYISGIGPMQMAQTSGCACRPTLDLLTWIRQNLGDPSRAIFHSVEEKQDTTGAIYVSDAFPDFTTLSERLKFGVWVSWVPIVTLCAALLGRWQDAFFLHEIAKSARFRTAQGSSLPAEYLFTSSMLIFRPLWTHIAEARGCQVRAVLYSTNVESFQREGGKLPPCPEYRYMDWPCYLVWNEQQEAFLKRVIDVTPKVEIVGNVWFADSSAPLPNIPARSIAYFDVQPKRESWIEPRGFAARYYTAEICGGSLTTLLELAEELDFHLIYKQKRVGGLLDNPVFEAYLKSIRANPRLTTIDPNLAPQHLIDEVAAVVSMPWTSTANIAVGMGKSSCYFDWSGALQPNDPAAHGVPILQNKRTLRMWLATVLNAEAAV